MTNINVNLPNPTSGKSDHTSGSSNLVDPSLPITVTPRIVKFGDDIYQLSNVTGFGGTIIDEGRRGFKAPWVLIIILGLIGLFGLFFGNDFMSLFLILTIGLVVLRFIGSSTVYGFGLYLNSGEVRVFKTDNKQFVVNVVNILYEALENNFKESE